MLFPSLQSCASYFIQAKMLGQELFEKHWGQRYVKLHPTIHIMPSNNKFLGLAGALDNQPSNSLLE